MCVCVYVFVYIYIACVFVVSGLTTHFRARAAARRDLSFESVVNIIGSSMTRCKAYAPQARRMLRCFPNMRLSILPRILANLKPISPKRSGA